MTEIGTQSVVITGASTGIGEGCALRGFEEPVRLYEVRWREPA